MRVGPLVGHARRFAPELAIATAAIAIAWTFAYGVLRHTPEFSLPLEDAYIYLTYAKQFGRAEPFTYYSGGGYSAGSTSVLWPMLLAPFWTLGARGHALVWVSFGMCTALYALTCIGCYRVVRRLSASLIAGLATAAIVLAIPVFAWTALAGMEVAFASALLVATIALLARQDRDGPPSRLLAVVLAAAALSRPEAMLLVFGIVAVAVLARARRRAWRAAAWWLVPLVPPLAWLAANKLLAGQLMPNTGVAKSHFYQPGFDWTYWWTAVTQQTGAMLHKLCWDPQSPLVAPRAFAVLWLAGAVRVAVWARREQRYLTGAVIVLAPWLVVGAVIASSGQWAFHNYRYIAPVFPLFAIAAGFALAPPPVPSRFAAQRTWIVRGWYAAVVVGVALFCGAAVPPLRDQIALYAQNAVDLDTQVVRIGRYVHAKLPDARVMFHDAGAVAYYGDTPVYDMLGLVTNHQAHVANHGPGSRFEFLESLPPERRPTHFVYYAPWMGQGEFYGRVLLDTPLRRQFAKQRLIGGSNMQVIEAVWHHVHTAERPLVSTAGWRVVDRVDIADLASERAHGWEGALGRRKFGDPTARWTMFHKEIHPSRGLLLDGGRTIRGGREQFTVDVDPAKPMRLVIRGGGRRDYPWHETIAKPAAVEVVGDDGAVLARGELPAPLGMLAEVTLELPRATRTLRIHASAPYRVFHYFVLQPD